MRVLKKLFFLKFFLGFVVSVGTVLFIAGTGQAKDSIWGKINDPAARFQSLANYNNQAVLDRETGLVWRTCGIPNSTTWADAHTFCYTTAIAGQRGWRLPTIEELQSFGAVGNPTFFPNFPPFCNTASGHFWSSSTFVGNTNTAWTVRANLAGETNNNRLKSSIEGVWCVRGGQAHDSGQ